MRKGKGKDNGFIVKLVIVFLLLGFAINLVADSFILYVPVKPIEAIIILAICIVVAWALLGDKIREAF